jgi:lysophospholipase L1-like esterase
MTPYRTVQRGYGGAKFSDLAVFAQRLICPHDYRALVIFVGNDVSGQPTDHTPDQVEQLVKSILGVARRHRPQAPVLLIEVTPTEKRWEAWPRVRELNARLREIALETPDTYFLPTAEHILRPDGTPRSELFGDDKLHLNPQGYGLWSELIRRRLDEIFRSMASVPPVADTPQADQN